MMRGRTLAVWLTLACCAWPAVAAPPGGNSCTVAATNINFGTFSGTAIAITGTITVKCTKNLNYDIGIDAGTGTGATVTSRFMKGGPPPGNSLLGYGLFQDAAHSVNWGETVGTDTVSGTGTGNNQTFSVYALLPSNEYAPAGGYHDPTVNVYVSGSGFTTATNHFNVNATVSKACNIAASSLNFGVYSGALINSSSTISVTCTNKTAYDIGLDAGTATGATVTNRSMTGPNAYLLGYKLFRDSNRTLNWGNTAGSDTVSGTGTGLVQTVSVYGQVPAGQTGQPPGSYSDTITATITY